jgi:hypothetical protein
MPDDLTRRAEALEKALLGHEQDQEVHADTMHILVDALRDERKAFAEQAAQLFGDEGWDAHDLISARLRRLAEDGT